MRRLANAALCLCLAACTATVSHEGLSVALDMLPHHTERDSGPDAGVPSAEKVRLFSGDVGTGYQFVVRRALVVIATVELLPCPSASTPTLLQPLFQVNVAKAHGRASPFAITQPQVIDLMDTDLTVRPLGTIEPPPGMYCGLRILNAPADSDAVGIEGAPDAVGHSLVVDGHWRVRDGDPDEEPGALQLRSTGEEEASIAFEGDGLLNLNRDKRSSHLRVFLDYGTMFDGVDPAAQADAWQAVLIQRNLLRGLRVMPCPDASCAGL